MSPLRDRCQREGVRDMSGSQVVETVQRLLQGLPGVFEPKGDVYCLDAVIAERKAFLSKQKLSYTGKFRVDEASKEVRFTEQLAERKSGLGAGGDMSPGFSFKKTKTRSSMDGLEGVIDETSTLFGEKYEYSFDYKRVRAAVKEAAEGAGYSFKYQVWGKL